MKIAIRFGFIFLFTLCVGFIPGNLKAQVGQPEVVFHLRETLISGNSIKIGYEIPYDGYIEFYLFDKNGERIWYTSYVKEKGNHYLALNRTKMGSDEIYLFDFWYKGKKYSGSFRNS